MGNLGLPEVQFGDQIRMLVSQILQSPSAFAFCLVRMAAAEGDCGDAAAREMRESEPHNSTPLSPVGQEGKRSKLGGG